MDIDYIRENSKQIFKTGKSTVINAKPNGKDYDKSSGYCIRTGIKIPFNLEKPMCYDAFKQWNKFGDPDYPEKFCHFSGEPSHKETSYNHPVLNKNWKKAKAAFNF